MLRAGGGGSLLCALYVIWSKALTSAGEGGATESGPGKLGGWIKPIGRGSHCWKWGSWQGIPQYLPEVEQTGLVLPARQCPLEGTWVGQRQQRAFPPLFGRGCPNTPEHPGPGRAGLGVLLPGQYPARSASPRRSSYNRTPASRSLPRCWGEGVV